MGYAIGYELVQSYPGYQIKSKPERWWRISYQDFSRMTYTAEDGSNISSSSVVRSEPYFADNPKFWKPIYYGTIINDLVEALHALKNIEPYIVGPKGAKLFEEIRVSAIKRWEI